MLIRKLEKLFRNFSENVVFYRKNVKLLSDCTILVILLSAASLNLIAFLSGILPARRT